MSLTLPLALIAVLSGSSAPPSAGPVPPRAAVVATHADLPGSVPWAVIKAWAYDRDDAVEGAETDVEDDEPSGRPGPASAPAFAAGRAPASARAPGPPPARPRWCGPASA